jgi:hypothetical protein
MSWFKKWLANRVVRPQAIVGEFILFLINKLVLVIEPPFSLPQFALSLYEPLMWHPFRNLRPVFDHLRVDVEAQCAGNLL